MGPFWYNFFEHLRQCGRNATLFLVILPLICALLSLGVALYVTGWYRYLWPALPFLAVFGLYRLAIAVRRARARRGFRSQFSPLSEIELRRARAKLQKKRDVIKGG